MSNSLILKLLVGVSVIGVVLVACGSVGRGSYHYTPSHKVYARWGSWSHWSDCNKKCGGGQQTRTRQCQNNYSGSYCHGESEQKRSCNTQSCYPPVDGGWSVWSHYGECSVSCGKGQKTRIRTCTYPTPAYGGKNCDGPASESVDCVGNSHYCPVDGGWSEWSYYSQCSVTCGEGHKTRTRTCTNPTPRYGGYDCVGQDSESKKCYGNSHYCPVHGGWSEWSYYSQCSVTCGEGRKTRTRTCTNPTPRYYGDECVGKASESKTCTGSSHYCPGTHY